jgi:hypothetical protein
VSRLPGAIRWFLGGLVIVAVLGAAGFLVYSRVTANPGCEAPPATNQCTRIVFFGNSYTAVNDLPDTFARLAWSGGRRIETATQAPGGWTLADHDGAPSTAALLRGSRWDFAVLQEQSEIPSVESLRQAEMYPAVRDLVGEIRSAGARPLLFLTWAHRDGWPQNGMADYSTMQSALDAGYQFIAREQHVSVVPVGPAWSEVVGQEAKPDLWQDDGSHPTWKGTYLAACVFYAAIFKKSPSGLSWHPWLSDTDTALIQEAAAAVVLDDPARWGLA